MEPVALARPPEPLIVSLPKDDQDALRFLADVDDHPDTAEMSFRIRGLKAEVEERGGTSVTQWSRLRHAWRADVAEARRQLHVTICTAMLRPEAKPGPRRRPIAAIVLGPPGAGKTTLGVPLIQERCGLNFVNINPDDIKQQLPEYEGWNAAALHEESAYVAESILRHKAVAGRFNVLYDIVGRTSEKVQMAMDDYRDFGYDVLLLLVDLPAWQAAGRVWERFQQNPFGRHPDRPPGRWVSPRYVRAGVGESSRSTFPALKDHTAVTAYCHLDAQVQLRQSPAVVDQCNW